jgi:hypothetical protein
MIVWIQLVRFAKAAESKADPNFVLFVFVAFQIIKVVFTTV